MVAKRIMVAANCEQRHLFLFCHGLVPSVAEYVLAYLTLSQMSRLNIILFSEHLQTSACHAMKYLGVKE